MRTLFLSEQVPFPLDSARNQRIYHILKSIASISEVTLLCFLRNHEEYAHLESLRALCHEIHCVPPDEWGYRSIFKKPQAVVWAHAVACYCHPMPMLLRWYESPHARRLVAELCSQPFDTIWVERLPCMALLPPSVRARVIVDTDDLEHRKLANRLRRTGWYRLKPFHFLEYLKLKRLENNLLNTDYEFAVCSAVDQAALGDPARVWVVPNGTNLPKMTFPAAAGTSNPVFAFVGSMSYDPNVDAVSYFVDQIFPRILREVPGARLLVIGRDPAPAVSRLHNGDSIVVTGSVPDVRPYLDQAVALVVPIRFGGGTRIKILEAMAYRKGVVSTSIGAEGIEAFPGVHLLVADDPEAFARACVRIWRDAHLRSELIDAAYNLVSQKYTWDSIGDGIRSILLSRLRPVISAHTPQ